MVKTGVLAAVVVAIAAGLHAQTGTTAPAGWRTYANAGVGYTIAYPPTWRLDEHAVMPAGDHDTHGTAVTVPADFGAGTNLSADRTGLSVEEDPGAGACSAARFGADAATIHDLRDRLGTWSVGSGDDAGAGNRYESTIFALEGRAPCLAVRYLIHSTNLDNYAPGSVKAFNRASLVAMFDKIRSTLTLTRK